MDSKLNRRDVLKSVAACAALGTFGSVDAVMRNVARAETAGERKFLFFFASGGWDATPLDPKFGEDGISPVGGTDMDVDTYLGTTTNNNLTWSAGPDRPNMDRYFTRWGHRTSLVRGVNVHSAGHESGRQWMMTGTSASSYADWPTILAAKASGEYPMPHLVFSGPSFPGSFGSAVVRGGGGTLLDLIDGDIVGASDRPQPVFDTPMDQMMDARVYNRAARVGSSKTGLGAKRYDEYIGNLERAMELEGRRFEAGLDNTGNTMLDQAIMALEVMRLGLSRCAMIGIPGGWDTHGGNQNVGAQMDNFFGAMDEIMDHVAKTPGMSTPWLAGEVTIVAMSELGRTPKFNGATGRDHWPYTSVMVAGSGVHGGRAVGETDEGLIANPVSFADGLPDAGGDVIGTENVGTAVLKLGGLDPENHLPGVQVLDAILR
jgi:hypothetical protein